MYIDISSHDFMRIFEQKKFHLPIRWTGNDFKQTLEELFRNYRVELRNATKCMDYNGVDLLCESIILSIEKYFDGHPSKAFNIFSIAMDFLMTSQPKNYQITDCEEFFSYKDDLLKLFRVRNVQQNISYLRSDIFHTPYNLRSKVAACRYSIAGYPSLYLGTSLELCLAEAKASSHSEISIASRFDLARNKRHNVPAIKVIDLGVKPQDFLDINQEFYSNTVGRNVNTLKLNDKKVRSEYVSWYPLIAACSFMRVSKSDYFSAEYIIPQLLMQWIRSKYEENEFFGIRYFSCASVKASEMGFNYVFPVSGKRYRENSQFCEILTKSFILTAPKFIYEFQTVNDCENALIRELDLNFIL